MKASEVPEKIYLSYETDEDDKEHIFIDYMWHRHPFESRNLENIEYTRTDAIIEKACTFLKDRIAHDSIDYPMATNHLIEDFKNYMKGE